MKKLLFSFFAIGILTSSFFAQKPAAASTKEDDQVVKISTNLIQIDVTVTDKNGKVVPGLTADDFELSENGEKQKISNLSFISRTSGQATATTTDESRNLNPNAYEPVKPGQVRRTVAMMIDDRNLSFASAYYTRKSLRKFVDEQMQPSDLVAIIRTGGGAGALQQFTSDKRMLSAAIDKIHWNPSSAVDAVPTVESDGQDITERTRLESNAAGGIISGRLRPNLTTDKAKDYNYAKNNKEFEEGVNAVGSLGVMRYVINGMKELPGRKVMMLFSDGLRIGSESSLSRSDSVLSYLRTVVDIANRASVVVYTFDTKGMQSLSLQASDNTTEMHEGKRDEKVADRLSDYNGRQDGLAYFAKQTGGKALLGSNDLTGGIQRALDEQTGYYLLGYLPDADTFDLGKRRYNKLELKVRRPGLNVSYRSGFFNTKDTDTPQQVLTAQKVMANALMSPFALNDIAVNVNALYADDPADGAYIRSFLHIDAKNLTFLDDTEGWKKASFDVAAVTFGDNGVPVENIESKYTIKTKGPTYDAMLKNGFVYVLMMPIKKPGLYQYRVALRDSGSGKIGSASQIVDVPNLAKQKLTLSSLAVESVSTSTWQNITQGRVGNGAGQVHVPSTLLYDTVLKEFQSGTVLRYGLEVYNAKADGSEPRLEMQAKILQNDRVVVQGNLTKVDASKQTDPKHTKISGAVMLNRGLHAGDYLLQITVTDTASKQVATQLFPFEIVE